MHYYAMHCPRGITTASRGDRLCRFTSKDECDRWVRQDVPSDLTSFRRDWVSRDNARRWFPDAFRKDTPQSIHDPFVGSGDYWDDDPDKDGALWWSGEPTGGVYDGNTSY